MSKRKPVLVGAAGVVSLGIALGVTAILLGSGGRARTAVPLRLDERGNLASFHRTFRDILGDRPALVRRWTISYVAHDGTRRTAFVVLPRWYGPGHHPSLPLVISPHGRGVTAAANLHFWGAIPAFGPFAVVSPEGQGRRLTLYSWGWQGQIDDLARMPAIVAAALPWLRIDRKRIYAVGSSMGGQETLLLVAQHPALLAGAAALDSATDMAARYVAFAGLRNGATLQRLAREEIGGTPATAPRAYADRSPVTWANAIAHSGVRLHIWWSTRDRIVTNQNDESGRLYRDIRTANPAAPVTQYVGDWAHSKEFYATARLPLALVQLGLIDLDEPPPAVAP